MGADEETARARGRKLGWHEYVDEDTKVFVSNGSTREEIIGYKFDPTNNELTVYLAEPEEEQS